MDMTDFTQNLADAVFNVREKRRRYRAYDAWGTTALKESDMTAHVKTLQDAESPDYCDCCGASCACTAENNCGCTSCWG